MNQRSAITEIFQVIESDPMMKEFALLICKDLKEDKLVIDLKKSIMENLMGEILEFVVIIKSNPWLIPRDLAQYEDMAH